MQINHQVDAEVASVYFIRRRIHKKAFCTRKLSISYVLCCLMLLLACDAIDNCIPLARCNKLHVFLLSTCA